MSSLIFNEYIKLTTNKKFYILLIVLASALVFTSLSSIKDIKNLEPQKQLEFINKSIIFLKDQSNRSDITAEKRDNYQVEMNSLNERKEQIQKEISNEKMNWKSNLINEITNLESQKKQLVDSNKIEEINGQIKEKLYYVDKNIKPETNYEVSSLSVILRAILLLNMMFLGLIIAIISSDIVSGEYSPPTIRLLLVKPISKFKLLMSKYILILLACLTSVLIIELVVFIIMGLIFKFGNPLTPIIIGTEYTSYNNVLASVLGSSKIIPLWEFSIRIILIQVLFIITCVSFCFFMSCLFKKAISSISISFITLSSLSFLSIQTSSGTNLMTLKKIMPFLFTTYSNGFGLITGDINLRLSCDFISCPFSICIMIAWSILFWGLSCLSFCKRDCMV